MFGRLTAIDFYGESTGVIVGDGKAFYTRDAGETWTQTAVPTEFTAVDMVDSLRVVAAGTGGEIWISEDGGATWARFGTECSVSRDVWSRRLVGARHVLAHGKGSRARAFRDPAVRGAARRTVRRHRLGGEHRRSAAKGRASRTRRVILSAHYDSYIGLDRRSICAPGADDNATGSRRGHRVRARPARRAARALGRVRSLRRGGGRAAREPRFSRRTRCRRRLRRRSQPRHDRLGAEREMTAVISGRDSEPADSIIARAISAAIDSFDLALGTAYLEGDRLASDHMRVLGRGHPRRASRRGKPRRAHAVLPLVLRRGRRR